MRHPPAALTRRGLLPRIARPRSLLPRMLRRQTTPWTRPQPHQSRCPPTTAGFRIRRGPATRPQTKLKGHPVSLLLSAICPQLQKLLQTTRMERPTAQPTRPRGMVVRRTRRRDRRMVRSDLVRPQGKESYTLHRVVVASASTKEPQPQNAPGSSPNRTPTVLARRTSENSVDGPLAPKLEQHTQSPMPDGLSSSHTSHPSAPTKASPPDPKVVSILELNSLLLRSV